MTFTWNTDDVYTYTGDTLDYYVTSGEIMVYEGRAVKSPSKSGIEINLRKIAEDWLEMEFRDFLEMNGELYHHEDAFRSFTLYRSSDDAVLYEFNCVINDLGVHYPSSGVYNDPIDGCADCRQKLFITYFGNWTGDTTQDIDVEDVDPDNPPYVPPGDYSSDYLTIKFLEDATVRFYKSPNAQISIDNGEWIDIASSSVTLSEEYTFRAGQTVRFAEYILQEKGSIEVHTRLVETDAKFDTYGNVYSITHGHSFTGPGCRINGDKYLYGVYEGLRVRDASGVVMPSDLRDNVYEGMSGAGLWFFFHNCTELERAPELNAMHVPDASYQRMFAGCTSLTKAPNLPATSVKESGYADMFAGCTSLITPPTFGYTATTAYMCTGMFDGCSSLTRFPDLPAVTVVGYAYASMFANCTSLRRAVIPSPAVNALSLYRMFYGCTSLSSVRLDATQWGSAWGESWLYGVSPTGYFYTPVPETYAGGPRGSSTVPENWSIVGV